MLAEEPGCKKHVLRGEGRSAADALPSIPPLPSHGYADKSRHEGGAQRGLYGVSPPLPPHLSHGPPPPVPPGISGQFMGSSRPG